MVLFRIFDDRHTGLNLAGCETFYKIHFVKDGFVSILLKFGANTKHTLNITVAIQCAEYAQEEIEQLIAHFLSIIN